MNFKRKAWPATPPLRQAANMGIRQSSHRPPFHDVFTPIGVKFGPCNIDSQNAMGNVAFTTRTPSLRRWIDFLLSENQAAQKLDRPRYWWEAFSSMVQKAAKGALKTLILTPTTKEGPKKRRPNVVGEKVMAKHIVANTPSENI